MEKVKQSQKSTVSNGWIKTTKESALSSGTQPSNQVIEEKIVSRVTYVQDPYAQVSFNTYQAILDSRNQMLGTVKPSMYPFDKK